MIIKQYPYIDENGNINSKLIRHYSNNNKMILQVETGIEYTETIDIYPSKYTYIESYNSIPTKEEVNND